MIREVPITQGAREYVTGVVEELLDKDITDASFEWVLLEADVKPLANVGWGPCSRLEIIDASHVRAFTDIISSDTYVPGDYDLYFRVQAVPERIPVYAGRVSLT